MLVANVLSSCWRSASNEPLLLSRPMRLVDSDAADLPVPVISKDAEAEP